MISLTRLAHHLWLDADDAKRALGADALKHLEEQVRDSETRHTGEICLCVEASLPVSYLWRHLRTKASVEDVVHERALALFGKLRVWDTELNNGVLIYLQLAERCVEIIADRGLAQRVPASEWSAMVEKLGVDFRGGRHEEGLRRTIDSVSRCLVAHFPASDGSGRGTRTNQLPDEPIVR